MVALKVLHSICEKDRIVEARVCYTDNSIVEEETVVPSLDQLNDSDFILDISSTFERKLEMLACHASQRDWLRRQHGLDEYLDGCRRWSATRGQAIGVEYGEAFTQHCGHPYPHDNLLLALLSPQAGVVV